MSLGPKLALAYLLLLVLAIFGGRVAPYDPVRAVPAVAESPSADPPGWGPTTSAATSSAGSLSARARRSRWAFTALVAARLGVLIGALSGYFGGGTDLVLMRMAEFFQMFPVFFVAIVIVTLTGPGLPKSSRSWAWPLAGHRPTGPRRVPQFEIVPSSWSRPWPRAPRPTLILRHILPNGLAPAVVAASFLIGRAILTEAGLSFLGLGDPSTMQLGPDAQQCPAVLGARLVAGSCFRASPSPHRHRRPTRWGTR